MEKAASLTKDNSFKITFTNDIGRLGFYKKLYAIFGLIYLLMFPLFRMAPKLFSHYFLLQEEKEENNLTTGEESLLVLLPYQRLFVAAVTCVAPSLYISRYVRQLAFFDTLVLERFFIVLPAILLTFATSQNIYKSHHPLIAVFVLEILGALITTSWRFFYSTTSKKNNRRRVRRWPQTVERFLQHFRNCPLTPRHAALRFESYMGLIHGIMCTTQMALTSNDKLSCFTMTVAMTLQYVLIWYAAHDLMDVTTKRIMGVRGVYIVGTILLINLYGFATAHLQIHNWSIVLGAIWPYLGGLCSGVGTLYSYYMTYSHYIQEENGPMYWMIGWAIIVLITSYLWRIICMMQYDDGQKERLWRSNQQDVLLAAFMVVVAGVLTRTQTLGVGTVGEPVGYLLPLVTLWFTNETKLLNHNKVGTPFHPSWWWIGNKKNNKNDNKKNLVPKFAKSELLNITFGIGTALITVVLTSYAFYAIATSLNILDHNNGIAALFGSFWNSQEIWKFAGFHGISMILTSGLWMIVASSGVGAIGSSKIFQPMVIPPLLAANPHSCIPIHKMDLTGGILLLCLSAFVPSMADEYFEREEELYRYLNFTVKVATMMFWSVSIVRKIAVHLEKEEKEKEQGTQE